MFVSNFRRGIVRSSLVRKSQYLGASCRAFSGSSGRGDGKSDLELHRDYQGIMPRFDAARGLLFTQEGEEKFEMYVEANIGGGFISKMLVLTDLEHPLFLKYNFDAKEFMKGAKHAFESVTGGVLHGEEFRNYVERSTIMSTANEMIDVILDREEELKASGETVDKKISQNLQEDIAEVIRKQEVGDKPSGDKANVDEEALEETSETVLEEVVSASAGVDDDEEDAMIEPVEFLRSVCTEEAFQDFVRITEKENMMKHKFLITNEELDSFFLSRAYIRFEEAEDHAQLDDEEGKGDDVVKKTTTNVDIENLRVIADINVKFITLCNINLPRRDGGDDKKWKMMRVFKWTFSSDINKGRDGLDWKISEVSASGWN